MKIFLFPLLWVLSILYFLITKVKFFLYSCKILNQKKLPAKVICIGNISSGGTGKTSTVIYLSKLLLEKGYKVAVLSRGYKRQRQVTSNKRQWTNDRFPLVVSNGKQILHSPVETGDEPYMIARNLGGKVPAVVFPDRYSAGKVAIEKFQSEILLLDDGFQHWQLYRDMDIVLVNCLNPFGQLLPLGLLREPPSALNRANIILLTNTNFVSEEKLSEIIQTIRKYNKTSPVIKSIHKPLYLETISTTTSILLTASPFASPTATRPLSYIENKDIIALSGIGNAKSFELTLKSLGANIVKKFCYSDHHWYTIDEIRRIANENILTITTEKDAVRLENFANEINLENILFLKIQLEVTDEEVLEKAIMKLNK
ncbi:MAG: tetraacyldisaccharide 4'-kinase [Elusimicrobiota bacterium]|nr:tetraacyldisaccharide 4'-kinase [Elusimicrobiota bacterium]